MKVSIIVPVYPGGTYLRACIGAYSARLGNGNRFWWRMDRRTAAVSFVTNKNGCQDHRDAQRKTEGYPPQETLGLCPGHRRDILFLDGDDFWAEPEGLLHG